MDCYSFFIYRYNEKNLLHLTDACKLIGTIQNQFGHITSYCNIVIEVNAELNGEDKVLHL